jgi:glycerate dehydrogenase
MKTKIIFLDRDTTDIGDIDFSGIEALGELTCFGNTSGSQIAARIAEANIVLTNKVYIGSEAMDAAKHLEVIQVTATGVNNVDLEAAKERGIKVFNVSGYSTPSVAQHVFAMLLNLVTHVNRYGNAPEKWAESPMFTRLDYPVLELAGKTLGIVGYGDIGKSVGSIGSAFGMDVVALGREGNSEGNVTRLSKQEFFSQCDVITLHCPLTSENYRMINSQTLTQMKPTSILINTGRGDLVAEGDLIDALQTGQIAAAGLDVISVEPPPKDHPVIAANLPNLLVTPHSAWSSYESRQRLIDGVVENIRGLRAGEEINRVA